jgi:AsmA protein
VRWMIRFGFGLAVLALLALGILALVPSDRVAAAVSAQFESLTGREMALEGEVKPRIWPTLGVTTGPVSIANAEWAESDAPLFRAESLSIDVNLGALFGGEVKVTGLAAEAPAINLERAADGRENWVFGGGTDGAESATTAPADRLYAGCRHDPEGKHPLCRPPIRARDCAGRGRCDAFGAGLCGRVHAGGDGAFRQ